MKTCLPRVVLTGVMFLLAGCSAAHRLPDVASDEIAAVYADLRAMGPWQRLPEMPERIARRRMRVTWKRLRAAGVEVCEEMQRGNCTWTLEYQPSRDVNAHCDWSGIVLMDHGAAEQSVSEDEIGLLMAHEMAHLALNHGDVHRHLEDWGGWAGATVGKAVGWLLFFPGGDGASVQQLGEDLGRWLGWVVPSRQFEREADYVSIVIAYRAGLDLDKARRFRVNEALRHLVLRSHFPDSHPLGAERVAFHDRAVAEVRSSGGQLPPRLPWSMMGLPTVAP